MTSRLSGLLGASCRGGVLFAAALAAAAAGPLQAAPRYVKTAAVRIFQVDSRQVAVSDGADSVIDAGFVPPGGMQLYWLQPGLGQQHLYLYDLASGTRKDASRLIPDGALPAALGWSPDGGRFAFADGQRLVVVATADRSSRSLDAGHGGFKAGQLYWMDSGHLLGVCANVLCLADLDEGVVTVAAQPKTGFGLPDLVACLPASRSFIWETWGPDSGSSVFLSSLEGTGASKPRELVFPQLGGESGISVTADGTYALLDTNIGNGDSPIALFMGNIKTGRWARLRGSQHWGDYFFARVSPRGDWIAVVASSTVKQHAATHLYLARVPAALRRYLDGKTTASKPRH